jgi:hypothetical protein
LLLSEDFFEAVVASETSNQRLNTQNTYSVGVFPNPFINSFSAEISSEEQHPVRLLITDLHGQIIAEASSDSNGSVTMGERLDKGMYILKVIKGKEVSSHRIIKK